MTEPAASRVRNERDAMDSIVLSAFDACRTIQLLSHRLSLSHLPVKLPAY
jgi:hypothetical protein